MIYDEKDQMEKDRNLWKFRLRVKSHVIPSKHHEEKTTSLHLIWDWPYNFTTGTDLNI
jgi:hypothetical protein